ncbi:MAG TPA: 3-oxo-tetronate kinase [Bauldia sp.]|nr:3-oxo-tetronate kinase [Bauldia sp.]
MLIGVVADDFTGASDVANALARGGMATTQFIGVPNGRASDTCDAGVVALKSRSIAAADAVALSLDALSWLKRQGCRQFVFKYCSTFDSTPSGNIGPVAQAMLDALDEPFAIVCPAVPAIGRRVFMGHLFVGDRLLSESGLERHPLNPMTDPDIRRWLSLQTILPVGLVTEPTVRLGVGATAADLAAEAGRGNRLIVVDAADDHDLRTIATAVAQSKLVTGAAGIAAALAENFRGMRAPPAGDGGSDTVGGPGLVLCGSCSRTSQQQVQIFLRDNPGLRIDPAALRSGTMTTSIAMQWLSEHAGETPIIYSTSAAVDDSDGRAAGRVEEFFASLAVEAVRKGTRRLVVGGGETSGSVVTALGIKQLRVGPEIDQGVPVVLSDTPAPVALALKSGNFGSPNFFAKALALMKMPSAG